MIARTKFRSEDEKREYVRECDADFEARLDAVMQDVCSREQLHYVTLSGPTCSGKTTASRKLISEFKERGRDVKTISLDDFFRDRAELEAELRAEIANGGINAADLGYVVITDYLQPNTGEDVSDAIQKVINENPRKTIYFPDGEYLISKPICTSSNPDKAVSLHLANFAVIKASDAWNSDEAMIRLGGDNDRVFTTGATGSNYYLYGGCKLSLSV